MKDRFEPGDRIEIRFHGQRVWAVVDRPCLSSKLYVYLDGEQGVRRLIDLDTVITDPRDLLDLYTRDQVREIVSSALVDTEVARKWTE